MATSAHICESRKASTPSFAESSTRDFSNEIQLLLQPRCYLSTGTLHTFNSSGDIHPSPDHIYQPRVPGNNNNNSRTMKLSVFYANARSIVNQIAKPQIKIASSVFDVTKKACGSCSHSISRSPKLPLVFYNSTEKQYMFSIS